MEDFLLLFIVVICASAIQTGTGFGFSMLSMPFLLFLYEPDSALEINISLSLLLSVIMTLRLRRDVDWKLLSRFILGSAIGAVPGLLLFNWLESYQVRLFIGAAILIFSLMPLLQLQIKIPEKYSTLIGGTSGFLTSSVGIPGPPLLIYFTSSNSSKKVIRSTSLCYFIFAYSISLILHMSINGTAEKTLVSISYSMPALVVGMLLGEFIFRQLHKKVFVKLLYFILLATGLWLIISVF